MPETKQPDSQATVQLEVRSKSPQGFRRAERFFGPDPVEDSFSEDVAARLRNEPQLFVREIGAPLKKPQAAPPSSVEPPKDDVETGDEEKAKLEAAKAAEIKAKAEEQAKADAQKATTTKTKT